MSSRSAKLKREPYLPGMFPPPRDFPEPEGSRPAPHNRTATSMAAAKRIREGAVSIRGRILEHIRAAGPAGRTRQEICDELGIKLQTVCARVNELLHDYPHPPVYEPAGERRDGRQVVAAKEGTEARRHGGTK